MGAAPITEYIKLKKDEVFCGHGHQYKNEKVNLTSNHTLTTAHNAPRLAANEYLVEAYQ